MKHHLSIIVIATLLTSIPAHAAAEKSTSNQAAETAAEASAEAPASSAPAPVPSKRHPLPLDHGPRAQSTPWLNQQTRLREEKAEKSAPVEFKPALSASSAQQ